MNAECGRSKNRPWVSGVSTSKECPQSWPPLPTPPLSTLSSLLGPRTLSLPTVVSAKFRKLASITDPVAAWRAFELYLQGLAPGSLDVYERFADRYEKWAAEWDLPVWVTYEGAEAFWEYAHIEGWLITMPTIGNLCDGQVHLAIRQHCDARQQLSGAATPEEQAKWQAALATVCDPTPLTDQLRTVWAQEYDPLAPDNYAQMCKYDPARRATMEDQHRACVLNLQKLEKTGAFPRSPALRTHFLDTFMQATCLRSAEVFYTRLCQWGVFYTVAGLDPNVHLSRTMAYGVVYTRCKNGGESVSVKVSAALPHRNPIDCSVVARMLFAWETYHV